MHTWHMRVHLEAGDETEGAQDAKDPQGAEGGGGVGGERGEDDEGIEARPARLEVGSRRADQAEGRHAREQLGDEDRGRHAIDPLERHVRRRARRDGARVEGHLGAHAGVA